MTGLGPVIHDSVASTTVIVIAHPAPASDSPDRLADITNRTVSSTDARLAFADDGHDDAADHATVYHGGVHATAVASDRGLDSPPWRWRPPTSRWLRHGLNSPSLTLPPISHTTISSVTGNGAGDRAAADLVDHDLINTGARFAPVDGTYYDDQRARDNARQSSFPVP